MSTEILDELFIAVALIAPQMKIAVDSLDTIAQCQQHPQQCDAVSTTAECHELQPFFCQQPFFSDESINSVLQSNHNYSLLIKLFHI